MRRFSLTAWRSGFIALLLMAGVAGTIGALLKTSPAVALPPQTGVPRASVTATTQTAPQVHGWHGVTAVPGSREAQIQLTGTGLSSLSSAKAVNTSGRIARGIRVTLEPGTDRLRQMRLLVKADAYPGRYILVGINGQGSGSALPFLGAIDFMVVQPDAGETPLAAMQGMIEASGPPQQASTPGSGGDRESLAESAGLSTGSIGRSVADFFEYGVGDRRLMEGGSDSSGTDQTTTVQASSEDTTSSDDTQMIEDTITVTQNDGSEFTHTMTYSRDSNGSVTESQTVRSKDSNGNVTYEHSCSGKNCTPMPDEGGCGGSKGCEQAQIWFQSLTAVSAAMQQRFVEARFKGMGGDATEPGGSSPFGTTTSRPAPRAFEVGTGYDVDPIPEDSSPSTGDTSLPTGHAPNDGYPRTTQPIPSGDPSGPSKTTLPPNMPTPDPPRPQTPPG